MKAETIFALSSGQAPAAISIIRLSGPRAHAAGELLAGSLPKPRLAALRTLRDPKSGDVLDQALVLSFNSPASSTGENSVEFQCHGGRAVVGAILAVLEEIDGLREAEPGEFTRRALENGRIDLTEAEGLADLIEAETESQRRAALLVANGGLTRQIADWRRRLLELSARAEVAIDYVDEDSIDHDRQLSADCSALGQELEQWLGRPRAEPLKDGVRVVIAGPPNAGKSSLLNAIVGYERAIVTDVPGTTRDQIEALLSLQGIPIRLTDTAGLRDSSELVERIGVDRAWSLIELADIVLWLGEPKDAPEHPRIIRVHARCDLPERRTAPTESISVSSKTAEGLQRVLDAVVALARGLLPVEGDLALNRRQALHIEGAAESLRLAASSADVVITAESLRSARAEFDRLTGRTGVEEVLDALFSRFCLGK